MYKICNVIVGDKFPSPTGVTYYECEFCRLNYSYYEECFRPQQGLPIMNFEKGGGLYVTITTCFRPQQGLPIMNLKRMNTIMGKCYHCFRPQQGLPIMN